VGLGGGVLYAPSALLNMSGNVQLGSSTTSPSPLIVNELHLSGNSASGGSPFAGASDGYRTPLATAMQALSSILPLGQESSGGSPSPVLSANNMGWLTKWAWLMLGLGQNPDQVPLTPAFGPDGLAGGSYRPLPSVENQSAAGLGTTHDDETAASDGSLDSTLLDIFFQLSGDGKTDSGEPAA
ncbi:MAG: hypothetical protein ACYC3I_27195, partial [Gemmataceae bacterium]